MSYLQSSTPCLELALEGERLCRAGEWRGGISCFRSALSNGTDDPRCLSAIYCQLGNAYFCQKNYSEALEYHRWHLTLARLINDTDGEAKASGNLGHTLKTLGRYDDAIKCFNRQLDLARQVEDQYREARALDELGNTYHAKGEQLARTTGLSDPGEFPTEAADAQRKAVEYYSQALTVYRQLGDRPAEGRVYGNLGNTHYLLGNFQEAIDCHRERLNFAREFGDVAAQRRAYSNLGNAFIFLADFNSAAENYRNALFLAQQLKDIALEAQACYSLGNTHGILQDHSRAVVYLLRHLVIARRLGDRVGEGRAHWSLTNEYTVLRRFDLALRCARRHRQIARELHDDAGFMTAQLMIREIKCLLNSKDITASSSELQGPACSNESEACNVDPANSSSNRLTWSPRSAPVLTEFEGTAAARTRSSLIDSSFKGPETDEEPDDFDPDLDTDLERELAATADDVLDTVELVTTADGKTTTVILSCLDIPEDAAGEKKENMTNFYSNTPTFQRHSTQGLASSNNAADFEDQLEHIGPIGRSNFVNAAEVAATGTEEELAEDSQEFFSLLLASQSRRMDEQRCLLHTNSAAQPTTTLNGYTESENNAVAQSASPTDRASNEALFDLIEGMQANRMDDQRANLPAFPGLRAGPGLQLFESASLSNMHGVMLTSTGSGASDGLAEPQSHPFSVSRFQRATSSTATTSGPPLEPDAEFLDMIFRLQTSTRINDQRSNLPDPLLRVRDDATTHADTSTSPIINHSPDSNGDVRIRSQSLYPNRPSAPTVPDEDFFALIQRVQATRLDEQRCNPPVNINRSDRPTATPNTTTSTSTTPNTNASQKSTKSSSRRRGGSWRRLSSNQSK